MELELVLERCSVRCPECGMRYSVLVAEDEESPFVCDRCGTPGVRVTDREPATRVADKYS